jgi:hypothetical protein
VEIDRVPGPAGTGIDSGIALYRLDLAFLEKSPELKRAARSPLAFGTATHVDPCGIAVDRNPKIAAEAGCCSFHQIFFLSLDE